MAQGKRTHGAGSITRRANGRFTAQVADAEDTADRSARWRGGGRSEQ